MQRHVRSGVLAALMCMACAPGAPRETPGVDPARPAGDPPGIIALSLFTAEPLPGSQLLFVGRDEFAQEAARWPGALFVPFSAFGVERDGIPNEFPPHQLLALALARAGYAGGQVAVVGDPIPAGRAYAAFDYLGLGDRAALIDGGLAALGAPRTLRLSPRAAPTTAFDYSVREDIIVDAAWVHARLNDPRFVLLDARPPAEYSGATPGEGITRPGHIPGARNLFWQWLVRSPEDPRLRDPEELRALFREAGVAPGTTIVAYCRTGGQSAFLYTVARHLRYDVVLYDGSFFDWSRTDYPVER